MSLRPLRRAMSLVQMRRHAYLPYPSQNRASPGVLSVLERNKKVIVVLLLVIAIGVVSALVLLHTDTEKKEIREGAVDKCVGLARQNENSVSEITGTILSFTVPKVNLNAISGFWRQTASFEKTFEKSFSHPPVESIIIESNDRAQLSSYVESLLRGLLTDRSGTQGTECFNSSVKVIDMEGLDSAASSGRVLGVLNELAVEKQKKIASVTDPLVSGTDPLLLYVFKNVVGPTAVQALAALDPMLSGKETRLATSPPEAGLRHVGILILGGTLTSCSGPGSEAGVAISDHLAATGWSVKQIDAISRQTSICF